MNHLVMLNNGYKQKWVLSIGNLKKLVEVFCLINNDSRSIVLSSSRRRNLSLMRLNVLYFVLERIIDLAEQGLRT